MSQPDTDAQFHRIAPLYDELMHDVPYYRWAEYLDELLLARRATPRRVLDLACGTGNMSEIFAAKGWRVFGVDIAPDMIHQARLKARERGLNIQYFTQDAAELTLPETDLDLCVSLFDSLNYVVSPQRLDCAMRRVAAHLSPGALFIFDMNSEFALRNKFFDQNNLDTDAPLRYDWKSEYFPDSRLCRIHMKFTYRYDNGKETAFEEEHWQYAYREREVVQMLDRSGFDEIKTFQAYTHRPASRSSDRIFYVARRRKEVS